MKINYLLIGLLTLVLLLAACEGGSDLGNEEFKAKLIEANLGIDSYSFDMTTTSDMTMEDKGMPMNAKTSATVIGSYSRLDKKMGMTGTTSVESMGMNMDVETEAYIDGTTMYTKSMGMWIKLELSDEIWEDQDQIKQMTDLIESGTIDVKADEGQYYVVDISPDLAVVVENVLKQQQQMDLFDEQMNFGDMIKEYSLTVWINKDTFIIEKVSYNIDMVMNNDNMGGMMNEPFSMDVASTTEMTMYGFNEEVTIDIPEEANDAFDFGDLSSMFENMDVPELA
ncbi:hypothetical protein H8D36_00125 [archaeon]|nr:hypothetical protein [archaeon]MBL7057481.1 hypothetical protein [Candidatus Woesearchaeota archaeon]